MHAGLHLSLCASLVGKQLLIQIESVAQLPEFRRLETRLAAWVFTAVYMRLTE
jgi:hypothetical protein